MVIQCIRVPFFHNLPAGHYRHPVAQLVNHRQIMGDEQIGQLEFLPQVGQQLRIWAWSVTSRADTGSSSTMSLLP